MNNSQLRKLIKEQIEKVLGGLTPDEIKQMAKYDLDFQSSEFSGESDSWDNEFVRNKYLDVLNNPTLDKFIEAVFYALPLYVSDEFEGDEIYHNQDEFNTLMDEYVMSPIINGLGMNRYKEVQDEVRKRIGPYSNKLRQGYLASR